MSRTYETQYIECSMYSTVQNMIILGFGDLSSIIIFYKKYTILATRRSNFNQNGSKEKREFATDVEFDVVIVIINQMYGTSGTIVLPN